jgi:two-component system nitrogen regulation sensor histidine kinase NtrY
MNPNIKTSIYLIVVHLGAGGLSYFVFENRWYFLGMQLLLGLSLFVGIRLFHRLDIRYRHLLDSILLLDSRDTNSRISLSGNPTLDAMISKYNQIMADIHEEQLLLESQGKFLEDLIQTSPIGILITDFDGHITDINAMAMNILEMQSSEAIGQKIGTVLPDAKYIKSKSPITITIRQKRLKLSQNSVRYKGFQRQSFIIEDITSDLLKTEKEAYGRVIRMMAHEVNNSVGAVNSILGTLSDYLEDIHAELPYKEAIHTAQNRNQNLGIFVDNFASVLRLYSPNLQPINLSPIVEEVAQTWIYRARENNVEITWKDLRTSPVELLLDPIQIEQVLHNILKNSLEAIHGSGSIHIILGPDPYSLVIADNGSGIDMETSKALIESPFYSTKPNGQGIGIMIIKEILHLHGASFKLETHKDGWTRFSIQFNAKK